MAHSGGQTRRSGAALGALLFVLPACPLPAEIVDRIACTVGAQVITESEILLQIRLAALMNREQPDFSAASKSRAAARLIDQSLLAREMDVSRFPEPAMTEVTQDLAELKERFQGEEQYRNELASRGIKEDELKQYLQWQLRLLRFVDFRFRAGVQITGDEVQDYYRKEFLPAWTKTNKSEAAPPLDDVSEDIEEVLIQRQVDVNTEQWLKQARSLTPIRTRDEVFR